MWPVRACPEALCHVRYRQILDNASFSIVLTDPQGTIKFVNKAFERITGYSFAEALGQNPRILKSGLMPDSFYRELWGTISAGRVWNGEIENKRKDGTFYYERFTILPVKNDDGVTQEFLAIKQDLTPQRAVEEKVRDLQEESARRLQFEKQKNDEIMKLYQELESHARGLERADVQRTEFVSFVSHELRTPLTVLREGVSIIKDRILGDVNEQQEEMLGDALESIDRLRRIIDDLLDNTKLDADKIILECIDVPVSAFVAKAVSQFATTAQKRGVALSFDGEAAGDAQMYADKDRIMQVVINLIGNALKFTPQGGSVSVKAEAKADTALITVTDTGRGISENDQKKLFDRFQQFGKAAREGDKGTGLGLSIAKRLVELHGGFIGVQSKEKEGSVFWFTIPLARAGENVGLFDAQLEQAVRTKKRFSLVSFHPRKAGVDVQSFALDVRREAGKRSLTMILGSERICVLREDGDRAQAIDAGISIRRAITKQYRTEADLLCHTVVVYPDDAETAEHLMTVLRKKERQKRKLVIADDDASVVAAFKRALHIQHFDQETEVFSAADGLQAYETACAEEPDAVVLDLLMPRMNGYEVIGRLRENRKTAHIPILILTGDPEIGSLSPLRGGEKVFSKAAGFEAVIDHLKEIV